MTKILGSYSRLHREIFLIHFIKTGKRICFPVKPGNLPLRITMIVKQHDLDYMLLPFFRQAGIDNLHGVLLEKIVEILTDRAQHPVRQLRASVHFRMRHEPDDLLFF